MTERPRVSSFEPRRLREEVQELKRIESLLSGEENSGAGEGEERRKTTPSGFLLRWWHRLFGHTG